MKRPLCIVVAGFLLHSLKEAFLLPPGIIRPREAFEGQKKIPPVASRRPSRDDDFRPEHLSRGGPEGGQGEAEEAGDDGGDELQNRRGRPKTVR